jgi:(1->4)-alpha-D-glucan 1-alpha-D-glucosylmutase
MNSMIREVIASLPVYRTYVQAETEEVSETDRCVIQQAIEAAKEHRPDIEANLFNFFRDILLLEVRGERETELVMRFQQCTSPVMAKGIEDTLFYNYNRFVALNEVGSEPSRFGVSPEQFHRHNIATSTRFPKTMLATATHDTKRGEDVRMRLALLSEMPQQWAAAVREWSTMTEQYRTHFQPDRNTEYLFYQTLVGAWPIEEDRLQQYLEKAIREAKNHTSWTAPEEEYEKAVHSFVTAAMADEVFVAAVRRFVARLIEPGRINSLAQTLLKLTSSGVPDIYQGTDLWDLSLVDPDNRRPVDYDLRRRLLQELKGLTPEEILRRGDEALPKLWVIRQTLALRRCRPKWFETASYEPLMASGAKAEHVVAFLRGDSVITITPRLIVGSRGEWDDTSIRLPTGSWRNWLTGDVVSSERVRLSEILRRFPVAILTRE